MVEPNKISNDYLGSKCNVILGNKYIEHWFSLLDSADLESGAVQKKNNSILEGSLYDGICSNIFRYDVVYLLPIFICMGFYPESA